MIMIGVDMSSTGPLPKKGGTRAREEARRERSDSVYKVCKCVGNKGVPGLFFSFFEREVRGFPWSTRRLLERFALRKRKDLKDLLGEIR